MLTPIVEFFVPGEPKPGGSKKGIYNPKLKRVLIFDDCKKNGDWRSVVALSGRDAYNGPLLDGAIVVRVEFHITRPKSHFRTGRHAGELKPNAPSVVTTKPDATKLWRSTEDALKGILWTDDARIAGQEIWKFYADKPGARIRVYTLEHVGVNRAELVA